MKTVGERRWYRQWSNVIRHVKYISACVTLFHSDCPSQPLARPQKVQFFAGVAVRGGQSFLLSTWPGCTNGDAKQPHHPSVSHPFNYTAHDSLCGYGKWSLSPRRRSSGYPYHSGTFELAPLECYSSHM